MKINKVIISIIFGVATSIIPPVLLTYGVGQFNIIRIVGQELANFWFPISLGIVSLSICILNPIGGYLFDKYNSNVFNSRKLILIGSMTGFLSMLFLSYANNIIILITFWVLSNFSYGLVSLLYFVLIPKIFKSSNFGKVSGLTGSLIPLAVMIISIIIMGGFSGISIENKILLIASIQLFCNLVICRLVDLELIGGISINNRRKDRTSFKYFYPNFSLYPNFTWTLLSRFCIHVVTSGLSMMTLFYIARFNLTEEKVFELQAITSLGIILMIASGILCGYLSDKKRVKKPFVVFSSISIAICMFCYSYSESIIYVIIISFFYQFFWGIFNSVDLALVNQVLPSKDNYAKDIAIMNTTNNIAKSLVSFITPTILYWGTVWMGDDGYTLFFLIMAIFSIISAVLVSKVDEKTN